MTDLELSLMRNIVDSMLPEFKTACETIMVIEPEIVGQESNPQFAETRKQIASYNGRFGASAYITELVENELKKSEPKVQ